MVHCSNHLILFQKCFQVLVDLQFQGGREAITGVRQLRLGIVSHLHDKQFFILFLSVIVGYFIHMHTSFLDLKNPQVRCILFVCALSLSPSFAVGVFRVSAVGANVTCWHKAGQVLSYTCIHSIFHPVVVSEFTVTVSYYHNKFFCLFVYS